MRISFQYQYGTYSRDISRAQERYVETQRMVTTGKKFTSASEDPFGAGSVLSLTSLKSGAEQYRKNLETAKGYLNFSESALEGADGVFKRVTELAVRGANATTDQEGRKAMVSEVNELQRRLLELGNTQGPNQQYIFAGQKSDAKPFTLLNGVVQYNGDTNPILVESGPGETTTINTDAGAMFVTAYNTLESFKASLNGGNLGQISGVDIPAIKAASNEFIQARGTVGTRLNSVQRKKVDFDRRVDDLTTQISDVEDVDLADAILQLKQSETAYQAVLNVAGQGFRLSLMDFIRG